MSKELIRLKHKLVNRAVLFIDLTILFLIFAHFFRTASNSVFVYIYLVLYVFILLVFALILIVMYRIGKLRKKQVKERRDMGFIMEFDKLLFLFMGALLVISLSLREWFLPYSLLTRVVMIGVFSAVSIALAVIFWMSGVLDNSNEREAAS